MKLSPLPRDQQKDEGLDVVKDQKGKKKRESVKGLKDPKDPKDYKDPKDPKDQKVVGNYRNPPMPVRTRFPFWSAFSRLDSIQRLSGIVCWPSQTPLSSLPHIGVSC